ncbi:hypothetical protein PJ900_23975 [Tistrella mobilis]|uniref:hypothetical protein n=1 Tax=Tistrella mobilis TaxID=171437 RepID=UPI0012E81CCA|nr:hypothetical protein [Tistrella mobilis]
MPDIAAGGDHEDLAFERLLRKDQSNIVRLVAYALHRLDERDHIYARYNEGRDSSPMALAEWRRSLPARHWATLVDNAQSSLDAFAEQVVEADRSARGRNGERFWSAVLTGVVSNLVFLVLFALLYGLLVLFGVPIPSLRIG